jgi:hypothetical protein
MSGLRFELVSNAVYRALREYDHGKRLAHDLRMVNRGEGPTIKQGSGRVAQTRYVTAAVLDALGDEDAVDTLVTVARAYADAEARLREAELIVVATDPDEVPDRWKRANDDVERLRGELLRAAEGVE